MRIAPYQHPGLDSNQSAHCLHSLIKILVFHLKKRWVPRYPIQRPSKTLIRRHRCSVLSEFSMGTHVTLYLLLGPAQLTFSLSHDVASESNIKPRNIIDKALGSIPLNIHEVWPRPFWGEAYRRKKNSS